MTTTLRVIHPSDILRVRADGPVDLDMVKRLLDQVAAAAQPLADYQVLVDVRDALGHLQPDDLFALAGSLAGYAETFRHKTAVLCPRERFDRARFFALLAAGQGFSNIRAFVSYEDAMEWLMEPAGT
jgi:hypothetical protein